jgi:hypothetical protein
MSRQKGMGRPSNRTSAMARRICTLLMEGKSLRAVCRMKGMPSLSTVMAWCSEDPSFAQQYAFACQVRAEALADEILDIADDPTTDWTNYENIRRARLMIDIRKWMFARMAPKRYGVR